MELARDVEGQGETVTSPNNSPATKAG
jgi:hypothetical protein